MDETERNDLRFLNENRIPVRCRRHPEILSIAANRPSRQRMDIFNGRPPSFCIFLIFLLGIITNGWAQNSPPTADNQTEKTITTSDSEQAELPKTRHERLLQKRHEKQKNLQPPKQPFYEKYLYGFDQRGTQSIQDANLWGFHPRIAWIARGSGVSAGVRYWKPKVVGDVDILGSAFISWRRYQLYEMHIGLIPNKGKRIPTSSITEYDIYQLGDIERSLFSRFKLYVSGHYRHNPQETYFGLGTDSSRDDKSTYLFKEAMVGLTTGYQFSARTAFTLQYNYLSQSLGEGHRGDYPQVDETFDETGAPGITHPPNYLQLRASFLMDYRDNPYLPHKGWFFAVGWEKNDDITANDYNYYRYAADLRGYIPLGSKQRVIALRGAFINSDPGEDNRVPFYLQPTLGGGESLRGYDAFRFVGEKMVLLQAEYRWEASKLIELALFTDAGQVAPVGQRMSFDNFKTDWGIGLRLKSSRFTVFRIDQAWGDEGPKTNFRFSAVF